MKKKTKILLVEDEMILRQGFEQLGDWGSEGFLMLDSVSNGQEALDSIALLEPDIVITDIVMPVMDGLTLIRILHKKFPHIQIVVLSNYDTFDYVKEALQLGATDYFLKSRADFNSVLSCLKKIQQELQKPAHSKPETNQRDELCEQAFLFRDLLIGKRTAPTFLDHLGSHKIGLYILFFPILPEQTSSEILLGRISKVIPSGESILGMDRSGNIVILTSGLSENVRRYYSILSTELKDLCVPFCLACGTPADSISQIPKSYKSASAKLPYSFYFENSCLFDSQTEIPHATLKINLEAFQNAISLYDYNTLKKLSDDLLEQASHPPYSDPYELLKIGELIINLVLLNRAKLHHSNQNEKRQKLIYFKNLGACRHLSDFKKTYNSILDEIILREIKTANPVINEVLQYLDENPLSDTSLRAAAEHFNINYSYLSQLFANTMHTSFTKYVTQRKIEKAVTMLQSGKYSVSQVCESLNFNDVSYFCKVFKKTTGQTPSAFLHRNFNNPS